jgi:membrane protein YdbS with pleckstrin-like domain
MREEPKHRISEKAITVWRISGAVSSAISWIIFFALVTVTFIFDWSYWVIVVAFVIAVIDTYVKIFVFSKLRWKRWRYEVHEHEIDIQHGLFIVKRTIIPMVRVQHVDTEQGPLLRKYRLATVSVSTAATIHQIPALDIQEAEELRDRISVLARVVDEDE